MGRAQVSRRAALITPVLPDTETLGPPDGALLDDPVEVGHIRDVDDHPMDVMSLLSRDIPKGPLLTAAQEIALARRMRGEDVSVPPPGESRPTPRRAHDRLVEQNMRLVLSIARKYQNRGLPVEDLVQEGAIGLRHAAEKFDPDRGWRFSTYATWWVRQAVSRALVDQSRSVRVPAHMASRATLVHRTREQLGLNLGRAPSPAELGAETGLSAAQVEEALLAVRSMASLDRPVGEDGDSTLGDRVADHDPSPEETAEAGWLTDAVAGVLDKLPPRERLVIAVRFGIGRDRPGTLEDVGIALGVSRERARQIESDALRRLRGDRRLRLLLD